MKKRGKKSRFTLKIRMALPKDSAGQRVQLALLLGIAPDTEFHERFLDRFVFEIPNPEGKIKVKDILSYLEKREKIKTLFQD